MAFARRPRFSLCGYDDPLPSSTLLEWIVKLASVPNANKLFVVITINQPYLISLLQADDVIPFVADDGIIAECKEVVGDGTLQAIVQQHEAVFETVVEDINEPSLYFDASGLDESHDGLRAKLEDVRKQLRDSRW